MRRARIVAERRGLSGKRRIRSNMPKTIYLPEYNIDSGINVTWTPTKQRLDIGGYYDKYCGIESTSMTLLEFFNMLGITEEQCKKAWKAKNQK